MNKIKQTVNHNTIKRYMHFHINMVTVMVVMQLMPKSTQNVDFTTTVTVVTYDDGGQGVVRHLVPCISMYVCISVCTLQTKWLKMFLPNL